MKTLLAAILLLASSLASQAGHPWDDVFVAPGLTNGPKAVLKIGFPSERTSAETSLEVDCVVTMDAVAYWRSIQDYDGNRGPILMLREPRNPPIFASLYCLLRPFAMKDGNATFSISVPRSQLRDAYFAYIPDKGNVRYLFGFQSFITHQLQQRKAEKSKEPSNR